MDSDVPMLYGTVQKKLVAPESAVAPSVHNKTGFAAWFVSHCKTESRREKLVETLQEYLPNNSIQVSKKFSTYLHISK